jgi:PPK2 family polyphosphate:nucleotide phosphotransferase
MRAMGNRIYKITNAADLVSFDGSFRIAKAPTRPPPGGPDTAGCERELAALTAKIDALQHILYAHDHRSLLLIFQGMDAAGKDSTVRAVLSGVDPAGCEVYSFKEPSPIELEHDFLWRANRWLPERGRIGVFNRSYYEDVLVVRVHPELLNARREPLPKNLQKLWRERYESIRDFEKHLARNGVVIVKFFLHVSRGEQKRRFLARLENPRKNWKFNEGDVREREHWPAYQKAYQEALRETSRPYAPWYALPADDKPYLRMRVAQIVLATLKGLKLEYPHLGPAERHRFDEMRSYLEKG